MNKTTEALKLAEEALLRVEQNAEECMGDDGMVMVVPLDLYNELVESLEAIRAARAQEQAEQAPVARVVDCDLIGNPIFGFIKKPLEIGTKLYAAPQPVQQEPMMGYERINALREGEQNGAEDAYFFVRPENDTPTLRKMFCQGFERGFHKGLKYASHVRTKDLTDDEVHELVLTWENHALARAVIAAYKEKQNGR